MKPELGPGLVAEQEQKGEPRARPGEEPWSKKAEAASAGNSYAGADASALRRSPGEREEPGVLSYDGARGESERQAVREPESARKPGRRKRVREWP